MAKPRSKTTSRTEPHDSVEELVELRESVERLGQIVQVLTQAVDGLTDELQWRNNELREQRSSAPPPFVLHSLPRDPCTDDWKVNRVRPQTLPPEQPTVTRPRETLFD